MRRLLSDVCLFVLLPLWLLIGASQAQFNNFPPGTFNSRAALDAAGGGGGCSPGVAASAFLARTSGLDGAHTGAYCTLINGLVTDSVWTKLDLFYVYATADSTTALLSLVSATFNGTAINTPTFAIDAGFTGDGSSSYVDSNFNPTTATTPNYVQDSASLFVWSNTSAGVTVACAGFAATPGFAFVYPRSSGDASFYGVQDDGSYSTTAANTDGKGFYVANRSASNVQAGYKNGVSQFSNSAPSRAPPNQDIRFLAGDTTFCNRQVMAGGLGGSLSGTDNTNLYSRVHAYLQTIAGIP